MTTEQIIHTQVWKNLSHTTRALVRLGCAEEYKLVIL